MTLGLGATGTVPEFFTSLMFLFLCSVLVAVVPERVFAGFKVNAIWLILAMTQLTNPIRFLVFLSYSYRNPSNVRLCPFLYEQ